MRLEFRGTQLSSDGGLLVMRELDDALGLSGLASASLCDNRRGKNTVHRLDGLFRQPVYGRLAGYEDVKDADRLALDPVMRQVVGARAVDAQAASALQQNRRPRRAPHLRNSLPAGRGRGHRPDGALHPRCHPPITSATAMRMTAIPKLNESGNRSVRCAENGATRPGYRGFAA